MEGGREGRKAKAFPDVVSKQRCRAYIFPEALFFRKQKHDTKWANMGDRDRDRDRNRNRVMVGGERVRATHSCRKLPGRSGIITDTSDSLLSALSETKRRRSKSMFAPLVTATNFLPNMHERAKRWGVGLGLGLGLG
jgi:hypothetical protein